MQDSLPIYASVLLLSTLLGSISQAMLKKSAVREHSSVLKEYLNPLVICAYLILFGCTLLTMYAYKVVPLGLGAVLEASGYIYITIIGVMIFGERLNVRKLFALLLVITGIGMYAFWG